MKTVFAAALLGTAAIGGIAYAQSQTATAPSKPMRGDTDADGKVSRAEFLTQAQARFAKLDVNGDGTITPDERPRGKGKRRGHHSGAMGGPFEPLPGQDGASAEPRGARMLDRLDTDGDGRISRAEFDVQSARGFARFDTNRDGTVDKAEMAAAPNGGRALARLDADASGTLTAAEFAARSGDRFARLDTNGDGFVDAAERSAMPRGMGQRRGGARMPTPAPSPSAPSGA